MPFSTDAYANNYLYLINVFRGTLTPANVTNVGPFTNISYRLAADLESDTEWMGGDAGAGEQNVKQTFELWTITIVGGSFAAGAYKPKQGDVFTDANGQEWNVLQSEYDDGVTTSTGLRPTVNIACQQKT